MSSADHGLSLVLPPSLLAEVHAAAEQEQRPMLDVLQDAVSGYLRAKRWQRTLAYGRGRAEALALSEDDVPRLIAESRKDMRQEP